jgi:hypothetical protein
VVLYGVVLVFACICACAASGSGATPLHVAIAEGHLAVAEVGGLAWA